jgi:hypothetical protein
MWHDTSEKQIGVHLERGCQFLHALLRAGEALRQGERHRLRGTPLDPAGGD